MLRRAVLTAFLVVGLGTVGVPAATAAAPATGPKVVAAVGDSITRAFDVNSSAFLRDAPNESWSTGRDTAVNSEVLRLTALYGPVTAYNDAVTGAKMASLATQMGNAVSQGADYVTVLMGANDVCTKTVAGMTPVADLTTQFRSALSTVKSGRPGATVFVSSIPNVYQLWNVLHTSGSARFAWSIYGVCQDMLSSSATEAQRQTVLTRLKEDNAALASVCAEFTGTCFWDGGATYNVQFTAKQVSTVDYFHPSVSGQAVLASTAWVASPYGP
jgi:lysophospholipase L1-like esterase